MTAVSISIDEDLLEKLDSRAKALGLKRSQYLALLAKQDIEKGGAFVLGSVNSNPTAPYSMNDAGQSSAKPDPVAKAFDQVVSDLAAQVSKSPLSKAVKKSSSSKSSGK